MTADYQNPGPTREEIDASRGPLVLEFGAGWCGYCQGAQPYITAALSERPDVPHTKVEDGPGRPLGRSFRVKLWPTVIALQDGKEVSRVVRPESTDQVQQAFAALSESAG
jgi:thioredoxin 1